MHAEEEIWPHQAEARILCGDAGGSDGRCSDVESVEEIETTAGQRWEAPIRGGRGGKDLVTCQEKLRKGACVW
jgi:hypothetical protein